MGCGNSIPTGKLSDRQITAIKKRLPSFLEGVKPPSMTDKQCESWIVEARTLYAEGKLPSWKIARIERIPGWTWANQPHRLTSPGLQAGFSNIIRREVPLRSLPKQEDVPNQ